VYAKQLTDIILVYDVWPDQKPDEKGD